MSLGEVLALQPVKGPLCRYEDPGQAKASMEFLVRCYAKRLAAEGINCNCVIPGALP